MLTLFSVFVSETSVLFSEGRTGEALSPCELIALTIILVGLAFFSSIGGAGGSAGGAVCMAFVISLKLPRPVDEADLEPIRRVL